MDSPDRRQRSILSPAAQHGGFLLLNDKQLYMIAATPLGWIRRVSQPSLLPLNRSHSFFVS